MIIITIGEMIVTPVAQAIAARMAPRHMRGRYLAMYGFSWAIPTAIGPLAAGLIMDNGHPHFVWVAAGVLGLVAALAYGLLQRRAHTRLSVNEPTDPGAPSGLVPAPAPGAQESKE
jgi:MFS family permease